MCDSNFFCWGSGECNSFLNNEEHCFDGGDCNRKVVKSAKCNDRSCCNEATAIAEACNTCDCNEIPDLPPLSICKECCLAIVEACKICNCNEIDQSDPNCKQCCLNGLGFNGTVPALTTTTIRPNGSESIKVTSSVLKIMLLYISALLNLV